MDTNFDDFATEIQCDEMVCEVCGTNHSNPDDETNCYAFQDGLLDDDVDIHDEPEDIDSDFGHDPYAGGPEQDDYQYDDWHSESDLWGEM